MRRYSVNQVWGRGLLAPAILNHFITDQDRHRHSYSEREVAHLEEAMGSVSLSEPEGSILRYVHVRGFHDPLIDPAKEIHNG